MTAKPDRQRALASPFIAFGGLLGVVLSLADNPSSLVPLVGNLESTRLFLASTLAAAVGGCVVSVFQSYRTPGKTVRVSIGGLMAALGLMLGWIAHVLPMPLLLPALVAGGALFGCGLALSFVRWGGAFGNEQENDALTDVAHACLLAALLKMAYLAAPLIAPGAPGVVLLAGLLCSCFPPVGIPFERLAVKQGDTVHRLKQAATRNWLPATGLVLLTYISASVWGAQTIGQSVETVLGVESSWGSTVGFLVGAILLHVLARKATRDGLRLLYQLVPMVCVALLLLAWLFASVNGFLGQFTFNIPIGCALAVMGSLLWVRLVVLDDALDARLVFGVTGMCYALFFLVVFAIWPLVGDTAMSLAARLYMVLFLAAEAIVSVVGTRGSMGESDSHDFKRMGEERCRVIGQQAQLSPRESEILVLLAQGRSAPFIAEELFVSTNTVKTHIRRIYGKMDVHSKEELLDVVHNDRY